MKTAHATLFKVRRAPDMHETKIREFFEGRIAGGAQDLQLETVFVLFTNRSGSNFCGDLLRTSGLYNRATECLNWDTVVKRSARFGYKSYARYLLSLRKQAVDGRLAIKVSLGQYEFLRRSGLLERMFPRRRVVVTERIDKIAQAVSWTIARQTSQWRSIDAGTAPERTPVYDFKGIKNYAATVSDVHRDMEMYLLLHREEFCRVVYEDVVADPHYQMRRVLRYLGHPDAEVRTDDLKLQKQASAVNEAFRSRFIDDILDRKSGGGEATDDAADAGLAAGAL